MGRWAWLHTSFPNFRPSPSHSPEPPCSRPLVGGACIHCGFGADGEAAAAWRRWSSSSPSTAFRCSWVAVRRGASRSRGVPSTESRSSSPKWVPTPCLTARCLFALLPNVARFLPSQLTSARSTYSCIRMLLGLFSEAGKNILGSGCTDTWIKKLKKKKKPPGSAGSTPVHKLKVIAFIF